MMSESAPSERTSLGRLPERGHYDRATIDPILDEALYCHLGIVRGEAPVVLPTIHVRIDDQLYVHGAAQSRLLREGAQQTVCVTVTLLDGLVLARSAFHHSFNYRSVVVFGQAEWVKDIEEKRRVLDALVEHIVPGRTGECRPPSQSELIGTGVLRIPLAEASAKIRSGPPSDAEKDKSLAHWAGIVPISLKAGSPEPDEGVESGRDIPEYLQGYARKASS